MINILSVFRCILFCLHLNAVRLSELPKDNIKYLLERHALMCPSCMKLHWPLLIHADCSKHLVSDNIPRVYMEDLRSQTGNIPLGKAAGTCLKFKTPQDQLNIILVKNIWKTLFAKQTRRCLAGQKYLTLFCKIE